MSVTVVVGAQWGDEGKAKVIDLLARETSVVARYQGGHNAGHTVVVGTEKYALQLIPSGVLYDHVTPVIGNGVVVDMPTLFAEIDRLESRGISCAKLKVSSQAHLIFPWHQSFDAISEGNLGENKIGTTLKGIGPAYADKARRVGIRVGACVDLDSFAEQVRQRALIENDGVIHAGGERLDVEAIVEQFVVFAKRLQPYITDTIGLLHDAVEDGQDILLEGAQATFLDLDHGTYPFVTSSNPTAGGASVGSGLGPRLLDRIIGITKAYTTRVGSGPFPTETLGEIGEKLVDIGREFGTVTGRRRRTGWVDCVMLRHAVRVNSLTELALTKLDVLDTFDEVKVCTGYRIDGELVHGYPDRSEVLAQVIPDYVTLPGWKTELRSCRSVDDLPAEAKAFITVVEQQSGVPIHIIGVGPERDDVLDWTPASIFGGKS
ncbi:MAG: adenylosuccinate synthase [Ilumatobacteraceae bacterium]|nr:adenylosuccinate synthase [Ilumatobacteraceae bacterium]